MSESSSISSQWSETAYYEHGYEGIPVYLGKQASNELMDAEAEIAAAANTGQMTALGQAEEAIEQGVRQVAADATRAFLDY